MRLRQGYLEEHLADLFGVSVSRVNRLVFLWLDYISIKESQQLIPHCAPTCLLACVSVSWHGYLEMNV